jgi:hypothetical protein
MEYNIYTYNGLVIGTRRSIRGAYNFCKRLAGLSNYRIQEVDEELDNYTSVNAEEFVYEYELSAIKDFSCFQTY